MTEEAPALYILYGSATGNAEQIAKDLAASSSTEQVGFSQVICQPLEKFKKYSETWLTELPNNNQKHGIVVVTSTTGNGDAPENASRFVRYLKRKSTVDIQPFQHCAFAVLGLGDTNYDNFCATGKIVDQKMQQLGGTRAKSLGMADEATGLEDVVEPWTTSVVGDMQRACFASSESGQGEDRSVPQEAVAEDDKSADALPPDASPPEPAEPLPQTNDTEGAPTTNTTPATSPPPATTSSSPLFILYGSATGNAEHIAKELASTYELLLKNPDAKCFFPSVVCCELDQYKKKCFDTWQQEPTPNKHGVLIVVSTTGNGDAPENASRFVRYIKRKSTMDQQPFKYCAFAVLGLGDTNYDQFCASGKVVDRKLAELGGTRVVKLATADEATGLEDTVEPWTSSIFTQLTEACRGVKEEATVVGGEKTSKTVRIAKTVLPTRTISDSSRAEEKKMESDVVPVSPSEPSSVVVKTIRSLLSLTDTSSSIPEVNNNTLPSLGTSLSSCELVHEEETGRRKSRGMSLVEMERMTISSGSTATLHYTMNKPHETTILNASYLTRTDTKAASAVANLIGDKTILDDKLLMKAMRIYEDDFPLCGPTDGSSSQQSSITYECNGKRVVEMKLSLPDDFTLEYQPGDSLGIIVPNTPQAVEFILNMLEKKRGVKPTQKVSIDSNHPVTVEEAVRTYIDLCSPLKNKRVLHSLSQFTTSVQESNALRLLASKTPQGEELFKKLIDEQRMTVVDVLKAFPSCQSIPLEGLIGMLPGIPPRYYSVSSSPLDPQNGALALTVALSVVDYLTPSLRVNGSEVGKRRIGGVATRFLEVICSGFLSGASTSAPSTLKIFPKPTAEFQLPASLDTPLILIGPGTGVAPFIGFVRHRRAQERKSQQAASSVVEGTWRGDYELEAEDLPVSKSDAPSGVVPRRNLGPIALFFGCRRADHDWLFQEEMKQLMNEGVITDLYTAFSRQEPKTYVQDIMVGDEACRASLVNLLLKDNASVYICGDGNEMAKDVQNAIATVIAPHVEDSVGYLENMKKERRLLMDIWTS